MLNYPVRLTAFEELFLVQDHPEFPSTFFFRIELTKALNRPIAERALQKVVAFNPLLKSLVTRGSRPSWIQCNHEPAIDWRDSPLAKDQFINGNLNIHEHPPLKILAFDGVDASGPATMIFLVHHTAFDGLGFQKILSDFLGIYRRLDQLGETDLLPECAPDAADRDHAGLLSLRCQPSLSFWEKLKLLPGQWKSIRETVRVLNRKVIPIGNLSSTVTKDVHHAGKPYFKFLRFSKQETALLRAYAARTGSSLNSILSRDLFVVIARRKLRSDSTEGGTHIRMMVPINERKRVHRKMSACNHCTLINLDRKPEDTSDETGLLQSIDQEFSVIAKWRLSLNFWRALAVFRAMPGGLKRFAGKGSPTATLLFTNLGRMFRKFHPRTGQNAIAISRFDGLAPLQRGMGAAFGAYSFDHQLVISINYDPHQLPSHALQELLDEFRAKLIGQSI